MRNSLPSFFARYYYDDQTTADEIGEEYSTTCALTRSPKSEKSTF
jgi:hypothetical protein